MIHNIRMLGRISFTDTDHIHLNFTFSFHFLHSFYFIFKLLHESMLCQAVAVLFFFVFSQFSKLHIQTVYIYSI